VLQLPEPARASYVDSEQVPTCVALRCMSMTDAETKVKLREWLDLLFLTLRFQNEFQLSAELRDP
jgi:hypothetical protein